MKRIVAILILMVLAVWLAPGHASADSIPFSIEPGKVIGYSIKAGSTFTFPITIRNASDAVKTFEIRTRLPDILSDGYEASDGKWVSVPGNVEVKSFDTVTIDAQVTAPEKSSETWIGITEDKTGLRYELVTKVMVNISQTGISSLGIVKYSQPGKERHILPIKTPAMLQGAEKVPEKPDLASGALKASNVARPERPFYQQPALGAVIAILIAAAIILIRRKHAKFQT